ncbi:hypothetical protein CDD80_409 [Ophiocordyceps camponoti-rufipedis]|uniref:Uncharacterized protein n=1 Tax=Ophiocordyceps camponoti-rufipedis TaxID=2004952 RepID=A0A2C5YJP8_9HYPO|nr:hypothetical protein CDD80_409 [Ophiocordyceps camponoti-rufipedis]
MARLQTMERVESRPRPEPWQDSSEPTPNKDCKDACKVDSTDTSPKASKKRNLTEDYIMELVHTEAWGWIQTAPVIKLTEQELLKLHRHESSYWRKVPSKKRGRRPSNRKNATARGEATPDECKITPGERKETPGERKTAPDALKETPLKVQVLHQTESPLTAEADQPLSTNTTSPPPKPEPPQNMREATRNDIRTQLKTKLLSANPTPPLTRRRRLQNRKTAKLEDMGLSFDQILSYCESTKLCFLSEHGLKVVGEVNGETTIFLLPSPDGPAVAVASQGEGVDYRRPGPLISTARYFDKAWRFLREAWMGAEVKKISNCPQCPAGEAQLVR